MAITYTDQVDEIDAGQLEGFFVGWPQRPDSATLLSILRGSSHVWLALESGRCIGFINAISDGLFSSYCPLLEVLPDHQGQGIGGELVKRMSDSLKGFYGIDVCCDPELLPFYEKHGFQPVAGAVKRNRSFSMYTDPTS